jgi:2',3'-cyclic-nucleotide 2'-phosphodiesterase (5'-nucleotidase family)
MSWAARSAASLLRIIVFIAIMALCLILPGQLIPVKGESADAAAGELYVTIIHTNDEHSAMIPHSPAIDFRPDLPNPTIGGYARLATAVETIRKQKAAEGEPVLLLSAGDFTGGTPFGWLVPEGIPAQIAVMHLLGYDATAIGNHEYDYGTALLAGYLQAAGYPEANGSTMLLASNTVPPPGHPLAEIFHREKVIELENGLIVGLFGLIGKDAIAVSNSPEPLEFTDQHETAAAMVARLEEEGVDLIIALTHSGVEEDRELAREVAGIDLIIGGHCHTALVEPIIEGETIIVQAGSLLECYGFLELAFDPQSGAVHLRNGTEEPYLIPIDDKLKLQPEVNRMIERYTGELNALVARQTKGRFLNILDPVASCNFNILETPSPRESPLGNFIADAMRLVTSEKMGRRADFAVQANGSIRGDLISASLDHSCSKVSFYDLADLIGLGIGPDGKPGYPVVSLYLTGEEVRRALEVAVLLEQLMGKTFYLQFSGLRYDYDPRNGVLFTVPGLDLPVPSTRAVVRAERYTGPGHQGMDDGSYLPLKRGDRQLYNLIADTYILSFLPMAGEMVPLLKIEPKDSSGNVVPLEELDKLIVRVDGEELKVWQTVIEYAAGQPLNEQGIAQIDPYYAETAGRINQIRSIPFLLWPALVLLVLVALIVILVRRRSRLKRERKPVVT